MGGLRAKETRPLSLFYLQYFGYVFVSFLALAALLLAAFVWLMDSDLVYPADQGQKQAQAAYAQLQQAEIITPEMIPDLCE